VKPGNFHPSDKFVFHFSRSPPRKPSSAALSRSIAGKENGELSLSQDGKGPMNEGRNKQGDSNFAMKAHRDLNIAQPGAELEKEQDEIHNPED
jgi:hypothetical protein